MIGNFKEIKVAMDNLIDLFDESTDLDIPVYVVYDTVAFNGTKRIVLVTPHKEKAKAALDESEDYMCEEGKLYRIRIPTRSTYKERAHK